MVKLSFDTTYPADYVVCGVDTLICVLPQEQWSLCTVCQEALALPGEAGVSAGSLHQIHLQERKDVHRGILSILT